MNALTRFQKPVDQFLKPPDSSAVPVMNKIIIGIKNIGHLKQYLQSGDFNVAHVYRPYSVFIVYELFSKSPAFVLRILQIMLLLGVVDPIAP